MLLNAQGGQLSASPSEEDLWTKNWRVINYRWPEIAHRLASVTTAPATLSDTPVPAPIFDGVQLVSGFDREAEARCQAEVISSECDACWVYGHGLGDLLRVLLEQPSRRCVVVLLNLSITRAVLEETDQSDWLSSSRVHLLDGELLERVREPFVVSPGEVRSCTVSTLHLRDQLLAKLNTAANAERFESRRAADEVHIATNRKHDDADTSCLTGTRPGPAVIIAGGPSLDGQWDWLKSFEGTIICASTSLIALVRREITPHFVFVIDTNEDQVAHFPEEIVSSDVLRQTTLVYDLAVAAGIPACWLGLRKITAGLFVDGTVAHPMIDLAVRLGALEVHLLGMDFCYPKGESHAKEVTLPHREYGQLWTIDGHGERVTTDPNMAQYHRRSEDFVAANPQVKWFKRGREGVPMRGVLWTT